MTTLCSKTDALNVIELNRFALTENKQTRSEREGRPAALRVPRAPFELPKNTRLRVTQLLLILSVACVSANAHDKPNVVFILADDLGWSDTTLFDTTALYKTPNIQRLAARGMTFTRAYSASPLCSPTRASVLTGLSPARHGITSPACHLPQVTLKAQPKPDGPPNAKATVLTSVSRLDTKYYTLAEMLTDNGYATGHFGKWHLGAEPYSPLEHGFDVDVPHHPGPGPAGSYMAPWKFKDFDHDPDIPDQHLEDRMAKEAVAFMEAHQDKPFFLNYWMFSVHAPFDAKQALIDKYTKQVDRTSPQRSPTYAAMIESMDDAVGTLLDTLDRLGITNNTIIIFASDNGGNMYNEVDGTSPTSNAPLRGGKATMWEGGVRGPAIVIYPDHVSAGTRSDELIQSCDFYPTLLELLSIKAQPQQTFDGVSIVPALQGKPLDRPANFTYFPHNTAVPDWLPPSVSVHAGDWKLIRIFHGGEAGEHAYKLYNLREDIGERSNLAADKPDRVLELDRLIDEFLTDTSAVVPLPNPQFDPEKFDSEMIGKAKLKRTGQDSGGKPKTTPGKEVAGWQPGGTCELALKDGALIVMSNGGDPHLSYTLADAINESALVLKFTMKSNSKGGGQVFWQEKGVAPAFFRDRSKPFEVQHDGETHDYSVELSAEEPILAVRIDPSSAPGEIEISNVRITTDDGRVIYRWKQLSASAHATDDRPNIIVFYTDDHGHADLSCQGVVDDIRTPHVDALAKSGVLARHGYSTAPQCVPSRAGLMIGKFQSRFGVETNGNSLEGFNAELTIAQRLHKAGYVTAQFGKWHLGPEREITDHGFNHVYAQNSGGPFAANITLYGEDREMATARAEMYHIDGCSQAAASLIDRYKDGPFFLYVAYRAPHVPLDAPKKYLDRFPGKMPERRRQALAMLSAVDDGVGLITERLAKHGLTEKTLIFYIGDNGAPLKIHKLDAPGGGPGWDGSLNDPLNGEKGMLAEGGMHVPFVVSWPGTIPGEQVYDHPISALDVAATAAELAKLETQAGDFDGVNLMPFLTGQKQTAPHEVLTWRWGAQSAIREGKWKLLRGGDREYLYDLKADLEEKHDLAEMHPETATRLREKLSAWSMELDPPGLTLTSMSPVADDYFDFYLEGKPPTRRRVKPVNAD